MKYNCIIARICGKILEKQKTIRTEIRISILEPQSDTKIIPEENVR